MSVIEIQDGENTLKFEIRPMPATKAEDFLYKVLGIIGKGVDYNGVFNGKTLIRALFKADHKERKELLDELLSYCYLIKGNMKKQVSADDADGYITSPLTLMQLRLKSAEESFGFFQDLVPQNYLESLSIETTVIKSEESPASPT